MTTEDTVWHGLSAAEVDRQYALRKLRPDYEKEMVPGWLERSAHHRDIHPGARIDLGYGPGDRDRFDLFPAQNPEGPFLIYIHGGYWQRGDKSVYSILSKPFTDVGIDVALINYNLCPTVRMRDIIPQVRRAVAHIWREARNLGCPRGRFCVMGHSAGGHLTAEMMATDWTAEADDLPADLIDAASPSSGVFAFEPVLYCGENDGLCLDLAEAREVSTLFRAPTTNAPQLVAWGELETPDWIRQSTDYVEAITSGGRKVETCVVPACDHFDVVDALADGGSDITKKTIALVRG